MRAVEVKRNVELRCEFFDASDLSPVEKHAGLFLTPKVAFRRVGN